MTGKIRIVLVAMSVAASLVAAAPAVLAQTDVTLVAYECQDLGTETVRVGADGTIYVRGSTFLGESVSDDARFDGNFRRRSNANLYPDGSAVFWGVHQQRSDTYNGQWNLGFRVETPDGVNFLGTGSGAGTRDFAGLSVSGVISGPHDGSGSPCNPVLGASTFTGVVLD